MEKIISLYLILTFTELFLCLVLSERINYSSRQTQRITNTEIRLDSVARDIAVFRLDILQIWEHLDQLNISCLKNCDSSSLPTVEINKSELSAKTDHEMRLYSAFKLEKKAVRNILHKIDNNVTNFQEQILAEMRALQESHASVKTKLNDKVPKIEKSSEGLKSLDKYTKSVLIKQEARIESLEKEMNRYKTAFETTKEELTSVKFTLMELEEFKEKVLNNLYKLSDCPSKWHKFSGSCYYFSTSTSNWTEANTNCRKEGAHLVEYDRIDEVEFVLGLVLSVEKAWSESKYAGFWAGGSDIDKEGDWIWSGSGKKVDTGFVNWYRPQPDDYRGKEDCMMSCIKLQGQWNDGWCPSKQRYVCEKTLLV
ncbi:asialoglycoprotein receptor 1-like [Mercenaria mercenaria]|uniref:asialoglycoprotein receptor 1-like n=1 Tax=Mercenaria mercenaria TaxID=6596 RepID=UPI00234F78FE|nr:asialoglycoprotein receptor 1-like [Mercenaria mercenaria]